MWNRDVGLLSVPFTHLHSTGSDCIVSPVTACRLQAVTMSRYRMAEWFVSPCYPGNGLVARLGTDVPTDVVLTASSLSQLRERLPPGLVRSERTDADPPDVIEVWYQIDAA